MANWENCLAVERDSDRLGGTWVFKGTRLPLYVLFDNLAAGMTIDQFSKGHGVDQRQVEVVLKHVADAIEDDHLANIAAAGDTNLTPQEQNKAKSRVALWVTTCCFPAASWIAACTIPAAVLLALATLYDALSGENTIHAALIAMCAAAIIIAQPASGAWPLVQRCSQPFPGLCALASGYLWAAKDAGEVSPTDQAFLGALGLLAFVCLGAAIIFSLPFWSASRPTDKGQQK